MIVIIKNNFKRIFKQKMYMFIALFLSVCAVVFSMFIPEKIQSAINKPNIAVVHATEKVKSETVNFFYLDEDPGNYVLVLNRYDALILVNSDGTYEIKTIHGKEQFSMYEYAHLNPTNFSYEKFAEQSGVEMSGIGMIAVVIMIQGIIFIFPMIEDKQGGTLHRIIVSKVGGSAYVFAGFISNIVYTFVPMALCVGVGLLVGAELKISYVSYLGIILLIASFSAIFAEMLVTIMNKMNSVTVVGSSIIVILSIISGTMIPIQEDTLLGRIAWISPLKYVMSIYQQLENGKSISDLTEAIGIIVTVLIILYILLNLVFYKKREKCCKGK